VSHNNSTAKNIVNTKIYQLQEIPAQDQIDYLLMSCRISEANDIFMLKGNKGGGDFTQKTNQFILDVGWIRLTKMMDFNAVVNDFKKTDLDPRELILLYKNFLVFNLDTVKKHFTRTEFIFDLRNIIEDYKRDNNKNNINTDEYIAKSKKCVALILEHKNKQFTSELKKKQTKIKF